MQKDSHELIVVLDFGGQYNQLIARRVRECSVYCEVHPHTLPLEKLRALAPKAIIFTGGPESVYKEDSATYSEEIFSLGVPVLGICYGSQLMAHKLGGKVETAPVSEYGRTELQVADGASVLFADVPQKSVCWMSHTDYIAEAPKGFRVTAKTANCPVAAMEDAARKLYAVQFHPEVMHTEYGTKILENFVRRVALCKGDWQMSSFVKTTVEALREKIGAGKALCALSGGVDSSVAAVLLSKAIGKQLTCVFVDHGLLREGEAKQVKEDFVEITGVDLVVADESERFLGALEGVSDPEEKRKIIGREFIRTFEAMAARLAGERGIDFLVQGTLYPDVVESGGGVGTANIKSHHNVGGLPEDLQFTLIEPLRTMFKDEVRAVGLQLGLPDSLVWRHPFPGPGLGIRIIGEVTAERLAVLRRADAIARRELANARKEREIWQFPVVLLADVRSVGVQGDGRTYGHPIVLRPVTSDDAMTADWAKLPWELLEKISTRITNECAEVNRVVLDITSKPPATIEWE